MFNRCESARDFKHTQWFLCICESSFVIEFTFDCFSIAIIPSNCSNFLQFLQNKISNYSHIVFNCSIVFLCSVEKSDSIVDLIFIRTTVKKTDCSIAWCNNYRWQTDSSFDFDVVIIYCSNSCIVSRCKLLKFRINLISYFFEAVCNRMWHIISILLINHQQLSFESCLCFQNIIFANIFSCVGSNYSHIHELLHIWHHFKQWLFIFEWNWNLFKCFFSMFIIFSFDCLVCLGIGRVFELVHFASLNSGSIITHQSKSIAQLMKHCLIIWIICLDLIQVWLALVSIAFNYKWFEELSHCSISVLCSINNICDSITNNFVSHIQLNFRIYFSCFQEINSFNSVFRWNWLNIASKCCSVLWITCNFCCFVSWICVKCRFFVE